MAPTDKICTKTKGAAVTNASCISEQTQLLLRKSNWSMPFTTAINRLILSFSKTWLETKIILLPQLSVLQIKMLHRLGSQEAQYLKQQLGKFRTKNWSPLFRYKCSEQQIKLSLRLIKHNSMEQHRKTLQSHREPFCSWNGLHSNTYRQPKLHHIINSMLPKQLQITNNKKLLLYYKCKLANRISLITSWQAFI